MKNLRPRAWEQLSPREKGGNELLTWTSPKDPEPKLSTINPFRESQ